VLSAAQRRELDERGFVRFSAFTADEAVAMQRAIWDQLSRVHGVRRDDPASWPAGATFGLQGIREQPTCAPIGGERLRVAIDEVLGAGTWDVPKRWGSFLVTFPRERGGWTVPDRVWHADFPFDLPAEPWPGLKLFTLIADVEPRMGGTLVVEGSHRVVRRYVDGVEPAMRGDTRRTRLALLGSDPWLRALTTPDWREDRVRRFMDARATIDDTPVRVVELRGRAGDVVLAHPWLLHCAAPNCASAPRFMRSMDLYRRDLHPNVARAEGSSR
jgi:hypothetical protein